MSQVLKRELRRLSAVKPVICLYSHIIRMVLASLSALAAVISSFTLGGVAATMLSQISLTPDPAFNGMLSVSSLRKFKGFCMYFNHDQSRGNMMLFPLTRREIAKFLEVDGEFVEEIWRARLLKRSLYNHHRFSEDLAASSIFDLIEFKITLDPTLNNLEPAEAKAWVDCLAYSSEAENWLSLDFEERCFSVLEFADDECLISKDNHAAAKIVCALIAAQKTLLDFVSESGEILSEYFNVNHKISGKNKNFFSLDGDAPT
jgi:hypothetical protein